jgi:hypothetical protein
VIADAQLLVMLLAPGVTADEAEVFLQQLCNLQQLPVPSPTGIVRGDWNLRAGTGTGTTTTGAVLQGMMLEQWGHVGEWYLVRDMAHQFAGWVHQRAFE